MEGLDSVAYTSGLTFFSDYNFLLILKSQDSTSDCQHFSDILSAKLKKYIYLYLYGGRILNIVKVRDEDAVIFGPLKKLPDPDPTCNNGLIKLFLS